MGLCKNVQSVYCDLGFKKRGRVWIWLRTYWPRQALSTCYCTLTGQQQPYRCSFSFFFSLLCVQLDRVVKRDSAAVHPGLHFHFQFSNTAKATIQRWQPATSSALLGFVIPLHHPCGLLFFCPFSPSGWEGWDKKGSLAYFIIYFALLYHTNNDLSRVLIIV